MPELGIKTGTYTGDGGSEQSILCGSMPTRVRIFDEDGNFAEKINDKVIAYQEVLVSGVYVMKRFELTDAIELITNGFKVKHSALNTNGKVYYWEVR